MLMKEKVRVTRCGGRWEGNRWVKDKTEPFIIRASVQDLPGETMEGNEEGRRKKRIIAVTSKARLYTKDSGRNADLLEWDGESFEVMAVKKGGRGTRLAYYKATAESLEDHSDSL